MGFQIEEVIAMMQQPAPSDVVDRLCGKLREVETHEKHLGGEDLANECRSYIFKQEEVKWFDILVSAYAINGGVLVRNIKPLSKHNRSSESKSQSDESKSVESKPMESKTTESKPMESKTTESKNETVDLDVFTESIQTMLDSMGIKE